MDPNGSNDNGGSSIMNSNRKFIDLDDMDDSEGSQSAFAMAFQKFDKQDDATAAPVVGPEGGAKDTLPASQEDKNHLNDALSGMVADFKAEK